MLDLALAGRAGGRIWPKEAPVGAAALHKAPLGGCFLHGCHAEHHRMLCVGVGILLHVSIGAATATATAASTTAAAAAATVSVGVLAGLHVGVHRPALLLLRRVQLHACKRG